MRGIHVSNIQPFDKVKKKEQKLHRRKKERVKASIRYMREMAFCLFKRTKVELPKKEKPVYVKTKDWTLPLQAGAVIRKLTKENVGYSVWTGLGTGSFL